MGQYPLTGETMDIIEAIMYFFKTTMVGRAEWSGQALNGGQRQADEREREGERESYTSITHSEKLQSPHQQYH